MFGRPPAARSEQATPPPGIGMPVAFVGPQGIVIPRDLPQSPESWYKRNPWARVGVKRIAQAVAGIPWVVKTKTGGQWMPAPEHPLARLLEDPAPNYDIFTWKWTAASWLILRGNQTTWLGKSAPASAPVMMQCLPMHLMFPVPSDAPPYIASWKYFNKGLGTQPTTYREDEILHAWQFNTDDPFFGAGDLSPAELQLHQADHAAVLMSALLKAGGLQGILKGKHQPGEQEENRILAWARKIAARFSRDRMLVIGEDYSFQEVGPGISDTIVEKVPSETRRAILATVGAPPTVANVGDRTSYAQAKVEMGLMYTDVAVPLDRLLLGAINRLPRRYKELAGARVEHDLTGIVWLQDTLGDKMTAYQKAVENGVPVNEARALCLGLPPIAGGEKRYILNSMVMVDEAGVPQVAAVAAGGMATAGNADEGVRAPTATAALTPGPSPRGRGVTAGPQQPASRRRSQERQWVKVGEKERVAIYRGFNAGRDRETRGLKKAIGGWYGEQGEKAKAKVEARRELRSAVRVRQPGIDYLLFDGAEAGAAMEDIIAPALSDLYAKTGQQAIATTGTGISFELDNPRAKELLTSRTQEMKTVAEGARERLRASLVEGLANGENVDDLTARVDEWIADGQEQYAETDARTETGIVMNGAAHEAFDQAGATGEEWLAIDDGRSGPRHHEDMDGATVGIDEMFTLPSGAQGLHPGDPELGEDELCNCRCTVAAVFDGNGGNEQ